MIKTTSLQAIAGALLACGLSAAPAAAQANRTFVSEAGTDSGACRRSAPCRTFAFALTQTNASGEIDVLDSAGYGAVTITKAISIINDAGTAGIQASSGTAITINVGASDSVHLRGLTIDGLGTGSSGIAFAGGNLAIENTVVRGFTGTGIAIRPPRIIGSDTAVLSHVITANNSIGISATVTAGSDNVTVVDSVVSNNSAIGIQAYTANSVVTVMVRNSVISYNGIGLEATKSSILIAHSAVIGNAIAGQGYVGTGLYSYGDNNIDHNGNDSTGTFTLIPMH